MRGTAGLRQKEESAQLAAETDGTTLPKQDCDDADIRLPGDQTAQPVTMIGIAMPSPWVLPMQEPTSVSYNFGSTIRRNPSAKVPYPYYSQISTSSSETRPRYSAITSGSAGE